MEEKKIVENFENFKKRLEKETDKEMAKNFISCLQAESFFLRSDCNYIEARFYGTAYDIIVNTIRYYLNEFEYYVNPQPVSFLAKFDSEVLNPEKIKDYIDLYFNLSIIYRNYNKMIFNSTNGTEEVLKGLKDLIEIVDKCSRLALDMQDKFNENIREKIKENKLEKKEVQTNSSIFS